MVEFKTAQLDAVFHALADPTRRAMLRRLADEDKQSVSALAAPFAMLLAAASKHIQTLERAGLVRREVQGRTHICSLDAAALADADAWIRFYRKFWGDRLDALERAMKQGAKRRKKGTKS